MANPSGDDKEVAAAASSPADGGGRSAEMRDGPPLDDCCPICFGPFSVPCRADCGHWYCASCILQYWNYSSAPRNCKCPMCSRRINVLVPQPSLFPAHDEEVLKVLENVRRYNSLFVGGIRGIAQKVCGIPLYFKRIFRDMMDPDQPPIHFNEMRVYAMVLGILYMISPFDFIPTDGMGVMNLFDHGAVVLVVILHLVGICRRRRLAQRVRNLAAIEQQHEHNP